MCIPPSHRIKVSAIISDIFWIKTGKICFDQLSTSAIFELIPTHCGLALATESVSSKHVMASFWPHFQIHDSRCPHDFCMLHVCRVQGTEGAAALQVFRRSVNPIQNQGGGRLLVAPQIFRPSHGLPTALCWYFLHSVVCSVPPCHFSHKSLSLEAREVPFSPSIFLVF
jgi:hypothetical protein